MSTDRLLKQIDFIKEVDKVKYIQRKTKLFHSNRHENDAEHSWHLAMMALVLTEHTHISVDVFKVLKMVLIHDIVEIDAGDTFLFDPKKNHTNTKEEQAAANRIFGILPKDQAKEFIALWEEFEAGETKEAKFAKALDRFQPVLQNISNQGGTWAEYNVAYETIMEKLRPIQKGSHTIWNYSEEVIKVSVSKGVLRP